MIAADWADTADGTWTDRPVNILVSVIGIHGRDRARRASYEHDITKPVDPQCPANHTAHPDTPSRQRRISR